MRFLAICNCFLLDMFVLCFSLFFVSIFSSFSGFNGAFYMIPFSLPFSVSVKHLLAFMKCYLLVFRLLPNLLVHLGCCNNTTGWVACEQQKFVSHSTGGWQSKIRVPAWLSFVSGEGPLQGCRLPTCWCFLIQSKR